VGRGGSACVESALRRMELLRTLNAGKEGRGIPSLLGRDWLFKFFFFDGQPVSLAESKPMPLRGECGDAGPNPPESPCWISGSAGIVRPHRPIGARLDDMSTQVQPQPSIEDIKVGED
jgi:hypothetical protein